VKITVTDPMHNLYLGTAKHVFKLWIEPFTSANLLQIEAQAQLLRLPADIGRLPSNISSGFHLDTVVSLLTSGVTRSQYTHLYS